MILLKEVTEKNWREVNSLEVVSNYNYSIKEKGKYENG